MLTRTKPQEKNWYKKEYGKKKKEAHSELKEPCEMLDKTKTLTTIARQKKAKEKALK